MGYDSWTSGIYNEYDGRFYFWEHHDEVDQLQDIIIKHLGKEFLWGKNGEYKIKLKDEYQGYFRKSTTNKK